MQWSAKTSYRLSAALVLLMVLQPSLGLGLAHQYRDEGWIRSTWWGNDWVTLGIGAPLLVIALLLVRRGSTRGVLLWVGMLGYAVYNFAFYLLGATLNVFFPLYVAAFVLAAAALILTLGRLDVADAATHFRPGTPARLVGGYLVFVAIGLTTVWLAMWAAHILTGRSVPGGLDAFRLVAALDLALMVPALAAGGVLLWKRRPWGYVIAALASVQGALYLLVLAVNGAVAIRQGFVEAPGELPIWGTLMVTTAVAAALLLLYVQADRPGVPRSAERAPGPDGDLGRPERAGDIR